MPIYNLSMIRILRKVRLRLERIQRNFLWGGGALERKTRLVNWKVIHTKMKREFYRGKSPLEDDDQLEIWCGEGGLVLKKWEGAHGMGLWKEIMKEATALRDFSEFFVRDGRRIHFWEDKWCGLESLGVAFPSVYTMAVSKGAFVA